MPNKKRFVVAFHALTALIIITSSFAILFHSEARAANYNYAEALQKSLYFFEAQRSGDLPPDNRVAWRGDSALDDGADVGHDLTGGWYDAGDHVKFGLPMAASTTMLAWGVVEYRDAYADSGQLPVVLDNIRWATDYFLKAHTAPNELYGQVGNGQADHAWWGPAELMPMERPAYKIDASCPGSDLAGETAAALAAAAIAFEPTDAAYADTLIMHATQLYDFAETYRGKYSDCITDARAFYNSWSGYQDELVWGALWLYQATDDPDYLAKAEAAYSGLGNDYRWTHAWDDKSYGSHVLLAKLTGNAQYAQNAERWLDYWTTGYNGDRVRYTPGGLAWLDQWGALRYTANTAFIAFVYGDWVDDAAKTTRYHDFAADQINYMLGDNPRNSSYVVGFGDNPPTKPHHRSSHGSTTNNINDPVEQQHTLYGALVGGPNNNDGYTDSRTDYVQNEVATDYNAGFTSALVRMYREFGGTPLANFPPASQGGDATSTPTTPETSVPTSTPVVPTATAPAPDATTAVPSPTSGTPGDAAVVVRYRTDDTNATDNQIRPYLQLVNTGDADVALDALELRYWYTNDNDRPQQFFCDWSQIGCENITGNIETLGSPVDGADTYVALRFSTGDLAAGAQQEMQIRLANDDWSNYDERNDYSFDPSKSTFADWPQVTLYRNGDLIWGTEPSDAAPEPSATTSVPTNTVVPSATTSVPTNTVVPSATTAPTSAPTNTPVPSATSAPTSAPTDLPAPTATTAPTSAPTPPSDNGNGGIACQVDYAVQSEWGNGFVVDVTIANSGTTTLEGWELAWVFADGQVITNLWNGNVAQTNNAVEVTHAGWNGSVASGESVSFGFQGRHSGTNTAPTEFRLNSQQCEVAGN